MSSLWDKCGYDRSKTNINQQSKAALVRATLTVAPADVCYGIWSKSPIPKSPFAERPMLKRPLFIGNQLGLVSVYTSVESDKKVLDWF